MSPNFPPLQPFDRWNQVLASQVHPAGWTNPTPLQPYQLVVIGAGTAGLVTAAGAAGLGVRVALIERQLMGGDCLNVGCVPSKALIASARAAERVRAATQFGVTTGGEPGVDFAAVMERLRRLRAGISPHDSAKRFQELGVDVYLGQGAFRDDSTVVVTGEDGSQWELPFRKAVIATGARAAVPLIPGIESVPYLTNETVFSLTQLPPRLAVLGGGPIGCELAQAFARIGSQVTLIERGDRLLSRAALDASDVLQSQLRRDGVQLELATSVEQVRAISANGDCPTTIQLAIRTSTGQRDITVDQLLVATGRRPNLEGLGVEQIGVATTQRGVVVDDFLRTKHPRIFAVGDVCSPFQFTHAADVQARLVIQNSLFALGPLGRKRASDLLIPWSVFTSPEIAHVGLDEAQATERGIAVDSYRQPLTTVDRAILDGQTTGFVHILTKAGTDQILGATIVAEHAGDLISELTLAMSQRVGLGRLAGVIHPYPTQAEAIRKLGDQYNRTRLTPWSRWLLDWLRRWNVGP
ncbi:MAG: mercuric reductase [Planctomycetaceae bacterium]|nr:mercuric reductase [Planctomycetaceae bacterium]